jgi:uncharacterized spore protein YtfJ
MPGKLEQVVDNLLDGMHQISKIETVVGEPLQAGDAMLVPIHRLRVGFGVASVGAGGHGQAGEGSYGGRGVGGGVQVEPIAVVAIAKDGRPRLMAIDGEPEQMLGQLFDQIPDLLGRVISLVSGQKPKQDEVVRLDPSPAARAEFAQKRETNKNE